MISTTFFFVCLSPLTTVLLAAQEAPVPVRRGAQPVQEWLSPLGSLRQATVVRLATVGDVLLAEDSRNGLTAIDPATGSARWFVQLPAPVSAWPVPGDGRLALACGQEVLVVSTETGTRRFVNSSTSVPCNSPVADTHAVYVPTLLGHRVVATSLGTGQVAWSYQMAAPITTPAQLIGAVGSRSVLIGCDDGMLRALPAGLAIPERERWVTHVGRIIDRPVVAGERVLVASADRVLHALDAASGVTLWRHLPGERLRSAPVAMGEIVVCSGETRLFAVHADTGRLAWEQAGVIRPVGEFEGTLLSVREDGTSELRNAATGLPIRERLPSDLVACDGMLIRLRSGTEIVAWTIDP